MTRVNVLGYDVLIAQGLLADVGEQVRVLHLKATAGCETARVAVITDKTVAALHLSTVRQSLEAVGFGVIDHAFVAGEASKNGATYLALLEWLASEKITRSDVIVALGGGVVGDLAGFVAATYLRGIPCIQVPTTLLAMVDSSVGGKTAIDLAAGKNLAGAFYQPSAVLCDPNVLESLPLRIYNEGMAEIVKHGVIASAALLEVTQNAECRMQEIIAASVTIKRDIVRRDEFDRGERQLLNFGHTVGHAIEHLSNFAIPHGYAVAIGMVVEMKAAVAQGFCAVECVDVLQALLERFDLPVRTDYTAEALANAALHDKKRTGGDITIVVPRKLGHCELQKISVEKLKDWMALGL
ncbi:MAG: 3-dehydroquinate synthase [Oscillospiraceae bacterium]|nr:3-dehydroquinate synthase [Oscillospiraceae bacterium]